MGFSKQTKNPFLKSRFKYVFYFQKPRIKTLADKIFLSNLSGTGQITAGITNPRALYFILNGYLLVPKTVFFKIKTRNAHPCLGHCQYSVVIWSRQTYNSCYYKHLVALIHFIVIGGRIVIRFRARVAVWYRIVIRSPTITIRAAEARGWIGVSSAFFVRIGLWARGPVVWKCIRTEYFLSSQAMSRCFLSLQRRIVTKQAAQVDRFDHDIGNMIRSAD
jgi:hypothetical protein